MKRKLEHTNFSEIGVFLIRFNILISYLNYIYILYISTTDILYLFFYLLGFFKYLK